MKQLHIVEKVEGEAKLHFEFEKNKIKFAEIEFFQTRYIENILQGKPILDALVINPRVCGICGHAHLISTVRAIEDCYESIQLSDKAKHIRELTLNFEIIQNHFKWLYLTLFPLIGKKQQIKKVNYTSARLSKAIAVIAGQYPHTSYAIVGGITSKVLYSDMVTIHSLLDDIIEFVQQEVVSVDIERFHECKDIDNIFSQSGDLKIVLEHLYENSLENIGKSFDRFFVGGEHSYFTQGKALKTRVARNLNFSAISEEQNSNSFAKNVSYKNSFYEVGALARAMVNKTSLIRDAHRRYQDSIFSRILARVCEISQLLIHSKKLLDMIDIEQPSFIQPQSLESLSSEGVGSVEAARGSLIHSLKIDKGIIQNYNIITPTQWNLSNGTPQNPSVSQKAMIGLQSIEDAELVFKSFDVCSVCTTH
jgi:Ni,Fe-hydrogenase I large subunit